MKTVTHKILIDPNTLESFISEITYPPMTKRRVDVEEISQLSEHAFRSMIKVAGYQNAVDDYIKEHNIKFREE